MGFFNSFGQAVVTRLPQEYFGAEALINKSFCISWAYLVIIANESMDRTILLCHDRKLDHLSSSLVVFLPFLSQVEKLHTEWKLIAFFYRNSYESSRREKFLHDSQKKIISSLATFLHSYPTEHVGLCMLFKRIL